MAPGLRGGKVARAVPGRRNVPYSPKYLEEEFCELRQYGVLGSTVYLMRAMEYAST
jgi:hypothetical protein